MLQEINKQGTFPIFARRPSGCVFSQASDISQNILPKFTEPSMGLSLHHRQSRSNMPTILGILGHVKGCNVLWLSMGMELLCWCTYILH